MSYLVLEGDCIEQLAKFKDNSVDSVVTDPPYGLEFMGKDWDAPWKDVRTDKRGVIDPAEWGGNQDSPNGGNPYSRARIRTGAAHYGGDAAEVGRAFQAWCVAWATECLRVLKPGGHMLAFGGTRTYHRMACAIEDAGFEIRDCVQWVYGTGFPKSVNLGDGWGSALKPANEPIIVARKPVEGTLTANHAKWGVGGLNIGATRITTKENLSGGAYSGKPRQSDLPGADRTTAAAGMFAAGTSLDPTEFEQPEGRWPSNFIMDEEAAKEMDEFVGPKRAGYTAPHHKKGERTGDFLQMKPPESGGFKAESFDRTLGPSRYFYVAKPTKKEKDAGLGDDFPPRSGGEATDREDGTAGLDSPRAGAGRTGGLRNFHVTVKPVMLMRYLIRLVTPSHGVVVDPFTGSGTTGIAALLEGCQFIGLEKDGEYVRLAKARIAAWEEHK